MTINDKNELHQILLTIEGQRVPAYRKLAGSFDFGDFVLVVDHVGDEGAKTGARLLAQVALNAARFPRDVFNTHSREIAARDFLQRTFAAEAAKVSRASQGRGRYSISIDRPGDEILERNAVVVGKNILEVRFSVQLPQEKGVIVAKQAISLFMDVIPQLVRDTLFYGKLDGDGLADWLEANEDADAARDSLEEMGLVAFVANGSRITYTEDRRNPDTSRGDGFKAPEECAVTLELPNRGSVIGMGIPKGHTVITGGWRQGKSELIEAIERGIWNHIPGRGHELIVTVRDAMAVKAEPGRRVEKVDVSPFFGQGTAKEPARRFSSRHADAPTSMAAAVMEALEIGTSLLIVDEDSAISPLLARDRRTDGLVPEEDAPARALSDVLPSLAERYGVSSIVGCSGSADMLATANTVLLMRGNVVSVITDAARELAREIPPPLPVDLPRKIERNHIGQSLEPPRSDKPNRQRGIPRTFVQYGDEYIDMTAFSSTLSLAQTRALSRSLALLHRLSTGPGSLRDVIAKVMRRIEMVGLDTLSNRRMGDLAMFRPQDLAAAVNRLRGLKVK